MALTATTLLLLGAVACGTSDQVVRPASKTVASSRPTLTWDSYNGVRIGESMAAAAAHLDGKVSTNLAYTIGGQPLVCPPSTPPDQQLITGIAPHVYISDLGGERGKVNWISLDRPDGVGPMGIAAGMTLTAAQEASGHRLKPVVEPATGQTIYTLPHGKTTFAFIANPKVSSLTITTPAELDKGVLAGGWGGGC